MPNTATKTLLLMLSLAALSPGQQYMAQDGHLLDANNRIGSMGWNGSGSIDALNNRNHNIMTGNISGGLSFQGVTPYSSNMQFRGTTNTNTLSNFRRDSIDISRLGRSINTPRLFIDSGTGVAGSFGTNTILNPQSDYRISTILNPRLHSRGFGNMLNNSLSGSSDQRTLKLLPSELSLISSEKTTDDRPYSARSALNWRLEPRLNLRAGYQDNNSALSSQLSYPQQSKPASAQADPEKELYFPEDNSSRIFSPDDRSDSLAVTAQGTATQHRQQYETWCHEGKSHLRQGRYYKAVDSFGHAVIYAGLDNNEALRLLTIARFAAGEYIGASINLYQAFDRSFTQTAAQDPDLLQLFDSNQSFYAGMKDLQRCYDLTENHSLLFLIAWLEYQTGNISTARSNMHKLSEEQPANQLFQQFGDYLESAE
ncbi:MAG: hypothetical protein JW745_00850 [Sedimentisphaerales bacterium]|nr:hypothetical protein [Sedimentisphaerales bacterium]MBN2841950.1 hypothetical protein [Sedimentisphaerales bacterium]